MRRPRQARQRNKQKLKKQSAKQPRQQSVNA